MWNFSKDPHSSQFHIQNGKNAAIKCFIVCDNRSKINTFNLDMDRWNQ